MEWRVILHVILQLVKLCIIGFVFPVQGSQGFDISPYPAFFPAFPPSEEIPGLVHNGSVPSSPSDPDGFVMSSSPSNLPVYSSPAATPSPAPLAHTRKTLAPSSPAVPNGSFLQPPFALPPPTSSPIPQKIIGIEPSITPSPSTTTLSPPHQIVVPSPSTVTGPPQREAPAVWPPLPIPIISAPTTPSADLPKISPVSQPTQHKTSTSNIHERNRNKGQTQDPVSPAPFSISSPNLPRNTPDPQPTEHGNLPPPLHRSNARKGHTPESISPVATLPVILPKISPVSQPTGHGSLPPNVHKRHENKNQTTEASPVPVAIASPPWIVEHNPPVAHPILPKLTPSTLPASVISPSNAFPVNPPSFLPGLSPSIPGDAAPVSKGGAPAAAPLYKARKPLPARIHSPSRAPAAHKAFRQFHHAPESLMAPHKSPFNKGYHSPASLPSTTFGKPHHARNIITSPTPASSDLVSPPISTHQGHAFPPSYLPTSWRRHYASPSMSPGSSVPPFSFPISPPVSQVSPAPSLLVKISPQPSNMPLIAPNATAPAKSPKTPILPRVQALPPPPPNEDCSSTVCREPYTNSPPGSPCACVLPMKVGLRFSVSLYTFFPLVSELASEIATGVFMKQSQVRIMGANAANQQLEKTEVMIDLVPLGGNFDNTTAVLTSERFWHKQVVIKASYFGDYEVLYVIYPGLPPSPPLPPSSITIIDGGPFSTNGDNGRTIKPLGVDVHKMHHKGGLSRGIIAIIALSAFVAVVLCSTVAWLLLLKFRDHTDQPAPTPRVLPPSLPKPLGTAASLIGGGPSSAASSFRSGIAAYKGSAKTFSMNDIEKATNNFHVSRILGEGGFGRVYSGILEDGTKVAFKVLKREDHHGEREFLAEVEMLSRLHHRNLVKLIGICAEDNFRCLVYELIPNGSVESHLHGVDKEASPLDWGARMKIALGAARGLAYLHEDSSPRVIHRDFKSSNILLEDDFNPKVSDFGLARTATDEENRHISTRVMGTFGYVAPEYAMTGHLLVKSDVYSYGVVLLELLTGRKPVDMSQPPGQENLVAWARPLLTSKEGLETIIDPSLGSDVPFDSVAKAAAIASMCVQPEVSNRPFMGEVVQALKLVCNECDEAEKVGSRSSSWEDLSVDMEMGASTASGQQTDNFQSHYSATNFGSALDIERGLSASEFFGSSARIGRQASGSFRIHSYSGPLRTGRGRQLWQIVRKLSGGSVSEHGTMSKL